MQNTFLHILSKTAVEIFSKNDTQKRQIFLYKYGKLRLVHLGG